MVASLRNKLKLTGRTARGALGGFLSHGGFHLAAAVAFYAILSLIPFFFVIVSIAGRVVGSSEGVNAAVNHFLAEAIPYYSGILMSEVTKISLGSGLYGIIGLLFIVWTGSLVFDSLDYAFNQVFDSPGRRSYLKTKLMSLSIFPAGGFLLSLTLFMGAFFSTLRQFPLGHYLPFLSGFQIWLANTALSWLPYLVLFAVLLLIFRVVPTVHIPYSQASLGAGLSILGWMVEKWIFGLVIVPNPNYGVVLQ